MSWLPNLVWGICFIQCIIFNDSKLQLKTMTALKCAVVSFEKEHSTNNASLFINIMFVC